MGAGIFTALSAIGTIGQVIGGVSRASAQERQYKEQGRMIDAQGRLRRTLMEREDLYKLSKNQARAEASGVASGSGSPLEVELANAFTSGMNRAIDQWEDDWRKRQARQGASYARQQGAGAIWEGIGDLASIGGKWWASTRDVPKNATLGTGSGIGSARIPNRGYDLGGSGWWR